jgi:hypothetical protein
MNGGRFGIDSDSDVVMLVVTVVCAKVVTAKILNCRIWLLDGVKVATLEVTVVSVRRV